MWTLSFLVERRLKFSESYDPVETTQDQKYVRMLIQATFHVEAAGLVTEIPRDGANEIKRRRLRSPLLHELHELIFFEERINEAHSNNYNTQSKH